MSQDIVPCIVALGNGVWLDEIRTEGVTTIKDVVGGSVTFATLGARLFTPMEPASIGMIFNAGGDWKGFERLTPPLPTATRDLQCTKTLQSRSFHFFGTAEYIEEQVADVVALRKQPSPTHHVSQRPLIILEPHARSCRPDTLKAHLEAANHVNIFSPNHEELASFFDVQPASDFDQHRIERQARVFIDAGIGFWADGCMVVRAAGHGCLVMSRGTKPTWLPAFYSGDSYVVFDPTGIGNTFLGAFAIGFQETESYIDAAMYGQVAASFVIEQVGLPVRRGCGDKEMWSSYSVQERLAEYRARVGR